MNKKKQNKTNNMTFYYDTGLILQNYVFLIILGKKFFKRTVLRFMA